MRANVAGLASGEAVAARRAAGKAVGLADWRRKEVAMRADILSSELWACKVKS